MFVHLFYPLGFNPNNSTFYNMFHNIIMTTGLAGSLLYGNKPLLLAGLKVHRIIYLLQRCTTAVYTAVSLHLMREVDFCHKAKRRRERKNSQTTPQSTSLTAPLTSGADRCGGITHWHKPLWNHTLSVWFSTHKKRDVT